MPNGDVLVLGSGNQFNLNAGAQRYDHITGTFSLAGPRPSGRVSRSTSTVLQNGKVLVVGGYKSSGASSSGASNTAELYDPDSGTWSLTGAMIYAREYHSATLLPNGKVLVVGGRNGGPEDVLSHAELYDPISGTWSPSGSLAMSRDHHTAIPLPNGKVLVVAGHNGSLPSSERSLKSCELYDPASGLWSATGSVAAGSVSEVASTLLPTGKVVYIPSSDLTTQLYDPATGLWSDAADMPEPRRSHSTALLPNGKLILISGLTGSTGTLRSNSLIYDPIANEWTIGGDLGIGRFGHEAIPLSNGRILIFGGYVNGNDVSPRVDVFDPMISTSTATSQASPTTRLYDQTSSLLPDGRVLVEGNNVLRVFDPTSNSWSAQGATSNDICYDHTATSLMDGRVLLVGGRTEFASARPECRIFDPATNLHQSVASLATAREKHSATRLPDGKVLVTGGFHGSYLSSCEIFDPETGLWSAGPAMAAARRDHAAITLPDGKVLITGGYDNGTFLASAEIYDPVTATWTAVGNMITARNRHLMVPMPNGKVLVVGGSNGSGIAACEVYDPASQAWSITGPMSVGRSNGVATLLPSGLVLVTGGSASDSLTSAEMYDMTTGVWMPAADLKFPRHRHAATLLKNGRILITGGLNHGSGYDSSESDAELYEPFVILPALRPLVSSASIDGSGRLVVSGSGFIGVSNGSQSTSESNFPFVRWRNALAEGPQGYLLHEGGTLGSDTLFTASVSSTSQLSPGYNFIEVVTNGAASEAITVFVPSADLSVSQPLGSPIGNGGARSYQVAANVTESVVFTIHNPGTADLTGLTITKDGPAAASFTVVSNPVSPVAPGGSTTFTVEILAADSGTKTATFHVASNVTNKSPYDITLSAVTLPADIAVEYPQGTTLAAGGEVAFSKGLIGNPATRVITIRNSGQADLTGLTVSKSGTDSDQFIIVNNPSAPVVAGDSTSFSLQFSPTTSGIKTATIHIASNDPDENPFDVIVSGEGIAINGLAGADLSGQDFSGADLSGADLTATDFTGAILTNAVLTGATVTGADFTGATLSGLRSGGLTGSPTALPASWQLAFGYLIGPGANLDAADLTSLNLTGIDFTGVDTDGADLTGSYAMVDTATDESDSPSGSAHSLREVIRDAPPELVVVFNPSLSGGTITHVNWPQYINKSITIDASSLSGGITLDGNSSSAVIDVASGFTVRLINLTLSNGFGFGAGGIQNSGILTVTGSRIVGNGGEFGAGISNMGTLNLIDSSITSNDSMFDGGGFANYGIATLSNVTVAENSSGVGESVGGGILNRGTLTLNHCTIAGNNGGDSGGGIKNVGANPILLCNTIVTGNTAITGADLAAAAGTITVTGRNLITDLSGSSLSVGTGVITGNARLAPIGNYGGSSPAMPPLPGSPVIEGGLAFPGIPVTDQLGTVRPLGPQPDIGAIEAKGFPLTGFTDSDDDGILDILEPSYPQFSIGRDDSALDSDGDGSTDAEEITNMTDPLDSGDLFKFLDMGLAVDFNPATNPKLTIVLKTFPGLTYQLESSDNLTEFVEIAGNSFIATESSKTLTVTLPGTHNFIRGRRVE